jgi:prepilin-type N-terminal cleavage/methylation domain-containing protein
VAIRPPTHNSQGFTLLEMLAVLGMTAVILGFAIPSFLTVNKPLRIGTSQFVSQLSLIRSKAISTNQAYRIKPKYTTAAQYLGSNAGQYNGIARSFIVEYAANCRVAAAPAPTGWTAASELDLDLPQEVGISDTATVSVGGVSAASPLNWSICYDNRGMVFQTVELTLKDFQNNNRAKTALINISGVGQMTVTTQDAANAVIPTDSNNNLIY